MNRAAMAAAPRSPLALLALGIVAAGIIGGCGGTVPAARFYVIDYEVPPANPGHELDLVLGVQSFSTQPLYRDRRIAHRASEHEVVYYPYSYWAAVPGELVADQLAEHLRSKRTARAVEMAPFGGSPDWVIDGHVQQFEEVVQGGGSVARLELSVRIESLREDRIVREEMIAVEKPVAGRGAERVAAAMSAAVQEAAERVAAMIQELAAQP